SAFAVGPADFKNVSEVGGKIDAQPDWDCQAGKVPNPDPHVQRALPEILRAADVEAPARNHDAAVTVKIRIRQVNGKRGVIGATGGAEEQGPCARKGEPQLRQEPGAAAEDTQFVTPDGIDVPEAIEHSEVVLMFQDQRRL